MSDDLNPGLAGLTPEQHELLALLAEQEEANEGPAASPIARRTTPGPCPQSYTQRRLWFLDKLAAGSHAYNIPTALRFRGSLDLDIFRKVLAEIVRRHEIMRTTFENEGGQPVQIIHPPGALEVEVSDRSDTPVEEREQLVTALAAREVFRVFDLSRGPLWRVEVVRFSADECLVLFNMHHIITDGWSFGILVREIATLYEAYTAGQPSPLPELPIQYGDVAIHQKQRWEDGHLASLTAYWREHLAGLPPLLELPLDFQRPPVQTYNGAREPFALAADLAERLSRLDAGPGTTLFMVFQAAISVLLSRYADSHDIPIGTPVANRNHPHLEDLIGFFVNTLVLRNDLSGNPTFLELLARVRPTNLDAYAHQDLPFEKLVEELSPERNLATTPLFQVFLVWQNTPGDELRLPGVSMEAWPIEQNVAKFDLTFSFDETGCHGGIIYNTDLFEAGTIRKMIRHLGVILTAVATAPAQRHDEHSHPDEEERRLLLNELSRTSATTPHESHNLAASFWVRAERDARAPALTYRNRTYTYARLKNEAAALARVLRQRGTGPETLVGLCMDRRPESVVAMLGVLLAGAAYVPMDPGYPSHRLHHMVDDAGIRLLIADEAHRHHFANRDLEIIEPANPPAN